MNKKVSITFPAPGQSICGVDGLIKHLWMFNQANKSLIVFYQVPPTAYDVCIKNLKWQNGTKSKQSRKTGTAGL